MEKTRNNLRHLGTMAAISPMLKFNSGSRMQMVCSQISQAVVPNKPDTPRILTGLEDQLATHTFGVKAPEDLQVYAVLNKYSGGVGANAIEYNPLVTVIYRSLETGKFGVFHVEAYQNQLERVHETFGFKYKFTPLMRQLTRGMTLDRGDVLSYSPTVENGYYSNGLNCNVAYMSVPATIEDGFEVSREFLERATPIATGTRVVEWGRHYYPINLYGDDRVYRPFPEIGDRIRDDGLVFALRKYDPMLDGVEMSRKELQTPDLVHDKLTYGVPGARIIDITVNTTTNEGRRTYHTPSGMEDVAKKYADRHAQYYDRIVQVYHQIRQETNYKPDLMPELQTLIYYAMGIRPNETVKRLESVKGRKNSIQKTYRASPMDEWRVEVMYEHRFKADLGGKISDLAGGKGVICGVRETEDMPVDDFGNRADVLVYGKGAVARLNPGQFYEHYINAVARDVAGDIRTMMDAGQNDRAWEHFRTLVACTSTVMEENIQDLSEAEKLEVLDSIYDKGIYLVIRADDEKLCPELYRKLKAFRPPNKSPVTYTTRTGERVRTKDPVLIGTKFMIVLDKLDHKPMAVSGILRQHHGLPAVQNKTTKHSTPSKEQPPRVIGETELRSLVSVIGGDAAAETMDLATNPESHRMAVNSIILSDRPSDIECLVDRSVVPIGGRPIKFVRHIAACAGWEIVRVPRHV